MLAKLALRHSPADGPVDPALVPASLFAIQQDLNVEDEDSGPLKRGTIVDGGVTAWYGI